MVEKTLRDEFAMAALTGLIALYAHPLSKGGPGVEYAATGAYAYADAMLAARAARTQDKGGVS